MRGVIVLLVIVVALALVGWITFGSDSGRSSINLETEEIRKDTSELMNKGSELLKDAEEEVRPSSAAEPSS